MPCIHVEHRVRSGDVTLAVREHSPSGPDRPSVVLVHGYPDQQDVWERLIEELPLEDWHVVTYDVRGAGASEAPASTSGYLTDRLVDDLVAVLDAVVEGPAHLVGHDWGSVQLWDAVAAAGTDPRLRDRIASFTSISGPSLDHMARLSAHPRGREAALLRQLAHSWYIGAFKVPVLPDLVWRHAHAAVARLMAPREGLPADHWGPELGRNAVNGLGLYRANVLNRMREPRRVRVDVPVLVIHPERDRYLTDLSLQDLDRLCSEVRVERVDAGHWAVVTDPGLVAPLVREHVTSNR
jgi:pimeloyl-ACP methyl ester carboxylesterase